MASSILSVATIKGHPVYDSQGMDIGEVDDLLFDKKSGLVVYVILCFAGFYGSKDRYYAIPRNALQLDSEKDNLILNVGKEELKNAFGFNIKKWGFKPFQNFVDSIYELFNYNPFSG